MPELDSQDPSPSNPDPLGSPFSPWHACGDDHKAYSTIMKRCAHLRLLNATCRLEPGQTDTQAAAQKWQDLFGIQREGEESVFTNARLTFVPGVEGLPEGLVSITLEVTGKEKFDRMLDAARREGVCDNGYVKMLGVRWRFELARGDTEKHESRL